MTLSTARCRSMIFAGGLGRACWPRGSSKRNNTFGIWRIALNLKTRKGRLRFLETARRRQIEFPQRAWRPPVTGRTDRDPRLDGYPKGDICDLGPGPGHRRSKKDSGPRAPATCPGPPCPGPRPGPNGASLHPRSVAIFGLRSSSALPFCRTLAKLNEPSPEWKTTAPTDPTRPATAPTATFFAREMAVGEVFLGGRTPFTTRIAVRYVLATMMGSGKPTLLNVMQTTYVNVS